MLFIAAAGNQSSNNDIIPTYPASFPIGNILAVAAIDNRDQLATFSNFGARSVHLGAPGVSIYSTAPASNYQYLSGTSMAAPHVAGIAALILSACSSGTRALRNTLLSKSTCFSGSLPNFWR